MAWRWRYEDANGGEVTEGVMPVDEFTSQADAESWLGENWRELLAASVEKVTLLEDDRVEYAGMSLREE
ncbi:hypothetical protein Ppa06_02800 [Planomonospora parontospora subsp. parontospora]|uniref:Uncharacterized protein n=2 Tax=Planomonospora parontospora TaxID=58119 RepID=A0AA37BC56_9ACTN|nr:hypothetical protein [Planomonospora parontospora]GGK46513.1 hypothetical protein GCM10010126_02810 [Planomonospora parontospora]GII06482.1 hypothetical protein Ppa06_02800 [Planomonospora parontospora subsp. parontospora]